MASHRSELSVNLPQTASLAACREAIARLGWRVASQDELGVVCEEVLQGGLSFTSPVRVEIRLAGGTDGPTRVFLSASNFGFGPIQANHVRKQVQALGEQIEVAAKHPPSTKRAVPLPRSVIINGQPLSDQEIRTLEQMYRVRLQPGDFWYDRITGAWGVRGGRTAGFILPGLNLGGPMPEDASAGNTGVFINGRQLPLQDVVLLQQIVPMVLPGRYWLDAQGNFGLEGGPPLGNIWALVRSSGVKREGILSTYDKTGAVVIG